MRNGPSSCNNLGALLAGARILPAVLSSSAGNRLSLWGSQFLALSGECLSLFGAVAAGDRIQPAEFSARALDTGQKTVIALSASSDMIDQDKTVSRMQPFEKHDSDAKKISIKENFMR